MHQQDRYWRSLLAIGVVTFLLGAAQIAFPRMVRELLAAGPSEMPDLLFFVSGVSFCLFGAMLINALRVDSPQYVAVLWAGLFHLSVAVLVGVGVRNAYIAVQALAVAVFSLCAGAMIIAYWFWIKQMAQEAAE